MNSKTKKIIKYIILAGIIVVGAYFYSFVKQNKSVKTIDEAIKLEKGQSYTVDFECKDDKLYGIRIKLLANGEQTGNLLYTLTDETGTCIEKGKRAVSSFNEAGYSVLTLDKIKDSGGNRYTVKIEADNEVTNGFFIEKNSEIGYSYVGFRLQTMIVFILCMAYLVALAKTLTWLFRK